VCLEKTDSLASQVKQELLPPLRKWATEAVLAQLAPLDLLVLQGLMDKLDRPARTGSPDKKDNPAKTVNQDLLARLEMLELLDNPDKLARPVNPVLPDSVLPHRNQDPRDLPDLLVPMDSLDSLDRAHLLVNLARPDLPGLLDSPVSLAATVKLVQPASLDSPAVMLNTARVLDVPVLSLELVQLVADMAKLLPLQLPPLNPLLHPQQLPSLPQLLPLLEAMDKQLLLPPQLRHPLPLLLRLPHQYLLPLQPPSLMLLQVLAAMVAKLRPLLRQPLW
jgi:hypothetical protein